MKTSRFIEIFLILVVFLFVLSTSKGNTLLEMSVESITGPGQPSTSTPTQEPGAIEKTQPGPGEALSRDDILQIANQDPEFKSIYEKYPNSEVYVEFIAGEDPSNLWGMDIYRIDLITNGYRAVTAWVNAKDKTVIKVNQKLMLT